MSVRFFQGRKERADGALCASVCGGAVPRKAHGLRSNKYKLADAKLVTRQNLKPLDVVQVFFNSKGAVMDLAQIGRVECSANSDNLEDMLGE